MKLLSIGSLPHSLGDFFQHPSALDGKPGSFEVSLCVLPLRGVFDTLDSDRPAARQTERGGTNRIRNAEDIHVPAPKEGTVCTIKLPAQKSAPNANEQAQWSDVSFPAV